MPQRVEAVLVADEQLQRREHGHQPDRHAQHDARFLGVLAGEEITRADRQHDEAAGEVGGVEHMHETIGEARVEDDVDPVERIGDAIAHLVAGWRVHPAIGRENPERRHGGADCDDRRRENVERTRHTVEAEQQHAEERRLEEERHQNFVADSGTDHVAGRDGEAAPIRAKLVGENEARHDAHRERHGEDLGPEPHQMLVAVVAGAQPHDAERGEIGREPDREAREDDVECDGESELQAGQQYGIEIHFIPPALSPECPVYNRANSIPSRPAAFRPALNRSGQTLFGLRAPR